ncbi:MAG: chorismate mutase [Candidatus Bathyarchaeota archaeon]|nr:chorismate mutase [Candidatus Bathyarchaeota archaeon]
MDDLTELRRKIDQLDDQVLLALSERVKVCRAIGEVKKKQGMPIRDALREKEVYNRIKQRAVEFGLDAGQVEALYHEIVNMCSAVQE